jgi:6-phosphogluconolactonase (cycloisomerase 2 family)
MRKSALAAVGVIALALGVVALAAAKPPPPPPKPAVGHVYINDNTAGENTVAGFDRQADGSLTPTASSPFDVGGAGGGHGNASQGSLQLSDDGRYLLAVDAGSNQISVLRIGPDGSLQAVDGSPFDSGGVNPVSIAVSHNLVFVANQGPGTNPGDTNYTGFRLDPNGQLTPIPGSTYALPSNSLPGQVLFNKDGHRLVGTRIATSEIDSFTVDPMGHLTVAQGSPFDAQSFTPPQGYGQLGSVFSPKKPDQLFVTDAHNADTSPAPGLVSSFSDDPHGVLSPIGDSPVGNDGRASCWIEASQDGRYLFVVNTASHTVSTYSVGHDGSIAFLQSTPAADLGGGAEDDRLAPDGNTLWVVQAGADQVAGFTVNDDGSLNLLSQTAGPAGAKPTGIVVT